MSIEKIGCCGAYCGTCKAYNTTCKGCKIGFTSGERDISKAKCKIKICCVSKQQNSCADCLQYDKCETIQSFHNHEGYKYGKYKQAIAYIKSNGYEEFLEKADKWNGAYGKY
ncbi:MAG: DUF3795 domain-containing protein [Oscillospiraceae bacterium]